jgi:hypothetical protein
MSLGAGLWSRRSLFRPRVCRWAGVLYHHRGIAQLNRRALNVESLGKGGQAEQSLGRVWKRWRFGITGRSLYTQLRQEIAFSCENISFKAREFCGELLEAQGSDPDAICIAEPI